ncbi:hypothetical protein H6G54_11765 [Anabaena cylindrica FACHB-243]|uniref:Uncharacterized protein n=1 Tax=Anabaena cylindrica (strain ATCC 27899 / PCC 7122) TaxID=272123 RepID=K9ZE31_ANACC|nr:MULTISPECIES: hypothetical protein [Anabaena]AFZ56994.1 hypothetical protein Anacy_1485 [Anabaena cylindrica PCC 7122]MBD2418363.1 hypothetical protein [Anabaena cylindrica FACHB-243]MBY5281177.1 hypothetical protein [Anabaena sp. CCAP 1446/1C]MBY5308710.1 hypothetical protein [Anabaena sp. CCAP 1446/1C]MCM2410279.1 hypothetical protein [Anabaena sp. CCAP 1446/1C]
MINKINGLHTCQDLKSSVDLELLEILLQPEDAAYPWNPDDQESEAYFNKLEQQLGWQDLVEEHLATQTQDFYHNLDAIWTQVYHSKTDHDEQPAKSLQASLHSAFAACVPANWLNAIAQKAAAIISLEQSASEKLVECIQALLPTWDTDDLLVLARPFAYSMRSSEQQHLTSVISNIENREWSSLSEIEQAKVSLAIADYALKQLSS